MYSNYMEKIANLTEKSMNICLHEVRCHISGFILVNKCINTPILHKIDIVLIQC